MSSSTGPESPPPLGNDATTILPPSGLPGGEGNGSAVDDGTTVLSPVTDATVILPPSSTEAEGGATTLLGSVGAGQATGAVLPDIAAGTRLSLGGRTLTIRSELGAGGAEAKTYLADAPEGEVVLKIYHRQSDVLERVLKRVASGAHLNVIRVLDAGSASGKTWEIMEYRQGGTLADHIRAKGPVRSADGVRQLLRAILPGLRYLHDELRVVYQDLKPDNILLPGGDLARATLTDFGISTEMVAASDSVEVVANGTRDYAAPELSRFGATHTVVVTSKVDYFALGVTLLESWTGVNPFKDVSDAKRRDMVLARSVATPHDLPEPLRELALGLLEPAAGERFGAPEVEAWIAGKPLRAARVSRKYPVARFDDQHAYASPKELAALLLSDQTRGEQLLFEGGVLAWLKEAGDFELVGAIQGIVGACEGSAEARRAGVYRAAYRLDPLLPFMTAGRVACHGLFDVGAALRNERQHYLTALVSWRDPLYAYMHGQMAGDLAKDALSRFLEGAGRAELALNHLIYGLERGDSPRVRIAGRMVEDPDEVASDPLLRSGVEQELRADHSPVLMWMRDLGVVKSDKAIRSAPDEDVLALLVMFPWLKLDEMRDDLTPQRRGKLVAGALVRDLRFLVRLIDAGVRLDSVDPNAIPVSQLVGHIASGRPGEGAQEALDFLIRERVQLDVHNGASYTPLLEAVRQGHLSLVQKLLFHGASVDFKSQDGYTPLAGAVESLRDFSSPTVPGARIVEALLAAGADPLAPYPGGGTIFDRAVRRKELVLVKALQKGRRYSERRAVASGHPAIVASSVGWEPGLDVLYPSAAFRGRISASNYLLNACRATVWLLFGMVLVPLPLLLFGQPELQTYPLTAPFAQWSLRTAFAESPWYWGLAAAYVLCLLVAYGALALYFVMKGRGGAGSFKDAAVFARGNKIVTGIIYPPLFALLPGFFAMALLMIAVGSLQEEPDLEWVLAVDVSGYWFVLLGAMLGGAVATGFLARKTGASAKQLDEVLSRIRRSPAGTSRQSKRSPLAWLLATAAVAGFYWWLLQ